MMSETSRRGLLFLVVVLLLAPAVTAGYTGTSLGVADSGSVTGNVAIEHGSSRYSGELSPGGTYTVTFPVSAPAGASIKKATVYLFWTWSHDGAEGVTPSLRTQAGSATLQPLRSYTDRKGTPPYDYPSGTTAYSATGQVRAGSPLTVTVANAASSAAVSFSGAVLLYAYDGGSTGAQYWVAEGADMIYATGSVSADAATTRVRFTGVPAVASGTTADLICVVPGGNKGQNTLTFNGRAFPGLFAGNPYADLAIARVSVGPNLRAGSNDLALRDEGDYMVPGLFVLRVAGGASASPTTTVTTTARTTTESTATTATTAVLTTSQIATTMSTTIQTPTLPTGPGSGLTFTPAATILASETTTVTMTPSLAENASTPVTVATVQSDPVFIAPSPGTTNTTAGTSLTAAPIVINGTTPAVTAEVTTAPTTTEPTIAPTTTEPTTVVTTTVAQTPDIDPGMTPYTGPTVTTATTLSNGPVILTGPPDSTDVPPTPTPALNASAPLDRVGPPAAAAGEGPGEDLLARVLATDGGLLNLGVLVFGLLAGGGIVAFSAIAGAGVVSYLGKTGERQGNGTSARGDRRDGKEIPDRPAGARRYGDDR